MRRWTKLVPIAALVVAAFGTVNASAHECEDVNDPSSCKDTAVAPNWREGNYVPLFDLEDRDDPEQRKRAQRWREECEEGSPTDADYEARQQCAWLYGGISFFQDGDPGDPSEQEPNEVHAGFAASHCFLFEFAHNCEDHGTEYGESVHDGHGGATYVDVCLTENPESEYCDDGMEDTQVGVTVMDHNPCGSIVPIVACIDEYHVIRPFDQEYTAEQMEDSMEYVPRILEDPEMYLCGKPEHRMDDPENPLCPAGDGEGQGDGARAGRLRLRDAAIASSSVIVRTPAGPVLVVEPGARAHLSDVALSGAAGAAGQGQTTTDAGAWWILAFVAVAALARRTVLAR